MSSPITSPSSNRTNVNPSPSAAPHSPPRTKLLNDRRDFLFQIRPQANLSQMPVNNSSLRSPAGDQVSPSRRAPVRLLAPIVPGSPSGREGSLVFNSNSPNSRQVSEGPTSPQHVPAPLPSGIPSDWTGSRVSESKMSSRETPSSLPIFQPFNVLQSGASSASHSPIRTGAQTAGLTPSLIPRRLFPLGSSNETTINEREISKMPATRVFSIFSPFSSSLPSDVVSSDSSCLFSSRDKVMKVKKLVPVRLEPMTVSRPTAGSSLA